MTMWFIIVPIILWMMIMTVLLVPKGTYSSLVDRVTKAKWRDDRVNLQIIVDHLRSRPDEWSVSREGAHFPREGAKQILLDYDKTKGWSYALTGFEGRFRPIDGHFEQEIKTEINLLNNKKEGESLLRHFYPELEGPLLLERYTR